MRFPEDAVDSVLWQEGSGLLWSVPADEAGGEGWWLVYLPPSYLDTLVGTEGVEWRAAPSSVSVRVPLALSREAAGIGGDVEPNFAGDDKCAAPTSSTHAQMFCPYDGTTSAHSWVTCNRSIRTELEDAQSDYPAVMIGGVSTTYVELVDLGTIGSVPLRGLRVGRLWSSGAPVPQIVVYGAQHAREWITSETLMRNMRYFASSFRDGTNGVRALLADRAILFVPVVNIAGYERTHAGTAADFRLWRPNTTSCGATPSGTDVNRNAPASWGQPGAGTSCSTSQDSSYLGGSAGSEDETTALLKAFADPTHYQSVLGVNTHAYGNLLLFTEGLSSSFTPCTTDSNCTAPDLGLFYQLAGTELVPRLRDEEVSTVPYQVGQTFRTIYAASGDTATETVYGSLPESTPPFMSIASELTYTSCGFYAEQLPPTQLVGVADNYRAFLEYLATQADELASGTTLPAFDLPLVHRRRPSGTGAEFPVWRMATRTTLTGFSFTPIGGGTGTTAVDDVRDGVFYREQRFTPTTPYQIPAMLSACATGLNCRTASVDGATGPIDVCASSRFTVGSGWAFQPDLTGGPQDECYWRFDRTGSAPWLLTSTTRNLQYMGTSRLVFSYRWRRGRVAGRVEVSTNGFSSCTDTNYGTCRIVGRFDSGYQGYVDLRDSSYRTAIYDVADFDGKSNVQVRFVVDTASSPTQAGDWDVFDPVFVGWYTGP